MNGGITSIESITSQGNTTALTDVNEDGPVEFRDCNGCGEVKPDVDRWAEHDETGEEIWLCVACGEW